jgi:hypothetical protein
MTAGTLWDSRTIQQELVTELVSFYESLLLSTAKVTTVALQPASLLDLHEVSRIMVMTTTADNDEDDVVVLGWVSNWGDAASRACEITFAGGGRQTRRDYVHWVQATVVGPETIAKLLQCNIRKEEDDNNRVVAIRKCLAPYLIHTPQNEEEDDDYFFVPLEELKAGKTTTPALATAKPRSACQNTNNDGAKLPPWQGPPTTTEQIKLEALTSPFDFLFR